LVILSFFLFYLFVVPLIHSPGSLYWKIKYPPPPPGKISAAVIWGKNIKGEEKKEGNVKGKGSKGKEKKGGKNEKRGSERVK
jgi:hypothetical protein